MTELQLPSNYTVVLTELKSKVRSSQLKAISAANSSLINLYFEFGRVLGSQEHVWGTKSVERLSLDLKREFSSMTGFSRRNLFYMKKFYLAWQDASEAVREALGRVLWGHQITLLTKVSDQKARIFYLQKIMEHGWSRSVLTVQVERGLYAREGKSLNNFESTLPPETSDLAQKALKDPYVFDFLDLAESVKERELEQGLVDHIQKFLVELGVGFAFLGRQYPIDVGDRRFYIDLLFYHITLRCFVVVELKTVEFEPEFAGKLNFYLSAIDNLMRHETDGPSIGLLLCKGKDQTVVEYALQDIHKPMGIADWRAKLVESLPKDLEGKLPSVQEIEESLSS